MSETRPAPGGNKSAGLTSARMNRNDEFYTQLPDIEAELRHYRPHFEDKVVLCNCDDPFESNFFKFFVMNFRRLGIKKLIVSCYSGSPVQGEQISLFDLKGLSQEDAEARRPYKVEITEIPDANNDGAIDLSDVEHLLTHDANVLTPLKGNGDFRSAECLGLLDEADIVVTNPPFSLFREYVATLIDHGKQFLILGDQNAITYPQIFRYLKDNRLWIGIENGGTKWFRVPDDYDIATESRKRLVDGVKYFSMGRIYWFTNLDHAKRHENLILTERYTPERYPQYDNFEAIEVSRVADIPEDWEGAMGVPITFLDKYNPEQFQILGNDDEGLTPTKTYGHKVKVVDGVRTKSNTGALRCVLRAESFGPGTYFDVGYPVKGTYRRVFIRRIGATS
ncbi:adenine-specific methyltransferase EcoRI family protein [Terrabacter terrae]|uniref:Adenine-specific methyltransferase EcoRI family protein n=1 Tax=Terrabacter terrae TaxID=318434 RepID=A0ABN2U429_9MICO